MYLLRAAFLLLNCFVVAKFFYGERHYAECRYTECRYTECRDASEIRKS